MGIEEFVLDQATKDGIEIGIEKGMSKMDLEKNTLFTHNLLISTDFDTLKIAELVGVSEDFVLQVKKGI